MTGISPDIQVESIKNILSKKSTCPDYRFNFGQYKGKSLEYVLKFDRQYLLYLLSEDFIGPKLRKDILQAIDKEEGEYEH